LTWARSEGLEPPTFWSVVSCRTSSQSAGVRFRRRGSTGCPARAPESGPVAPVC